MRTRAYTPATDYSPKAHDSKLYLLEGVPTAEEDWGFKVRDFGWETAQCFVSRRQNVSARSIGAAAPNSLSSLLENAPREDDEHFPSKG
jgi:hypothetical protein